MTGREEVGAAPEEVEAELSELLGEQENISDDHALTAAAYFHVKFENIHPFADGNGRVRSLSTNYKIALVNRAAGELEGSEASER